jgi:hypothetical protein
MRTMKPTVYIDAVPLLRFRIAAYGLVRRPVQGFVVWAALTGGALGGLGLGWAHSTGSPVHPASAKTTADDCSLHAAHRG